MTIGGVYVGRVDDDEIAYVQGELGVVDGDVHAAFADADDFHTVMPMVCDKVVRITVGVKADLDIFSGFNFFVDIFFHMYVGLSVFLCSS